MVFMEKNNQTERREKLNLENNLPVVESAVYETVKETEFLRTPGVAVLSVPNVELSNAKNFLGGFPDELGFDDYFKDTGLLPPAEVLSKFAGQLCYMSFGKERTKNDRADSYFKNIMESGHGSVLEHANVSMLFWGVSRSLTHELIRHRAGFAYSQVSQRYVGGKTLRFVERPEYAADKVLHEKFMERIDVVKEEYEGLTDYLYQKQAEGVGLLSGERKTDLRKKVRQAARSVLPNETEAPIIVTGNLRAWRHFLNMRGSEHAEIEIRNLAVETYRCLCMIAPKLFGDFEVEKLSDGTLGLKTNYPKV